MVQGDHIEPARSQIGMIILSGLLIILTLALAAAIGRGQEPSPPQPPRIEYYTTDDGKQVPIIDGNITVYHAYTRSQPSPTVRRSLVQPATQRQTYRPEVRQSPFPSPTRTINARVAARVSTRLADTTLTGSINTRANTAELVGDTSKPP